MIERRAMRRITAIAGLLAALGASTASANPFAAGDVVVYRVGDGVTPLAGTGSPVFLDEYTPNGVLVQSIPLPTTTSGVSQQLVASGTATSEGQLTRSADGRYLLLTGYASDLGGTADLSTSLATVVPRTVGRVASDGSVDTSTALTDFAEGNNPRSATSTDGTNLWVGGATGGVRYATLGSAVSVQLSTNSTNIRYVNVFGSQLYMSSQKTTLRVATVGSGTPTTAGQAISNLPGFPTTGDPNAFFFADLDAVAGVDTLYVADDINGLEKFSLVSGSWVANGTAGVGTDAYRGLTGTLSGTSVTLYATRNGGELVRLVDGSGHNGPFSGTPTVLAGASTDTAFRGVALAPAPPAGPMATPTATVAGPTSTAPMATSTFTSAALTPTPTSTGTPPPRTPTPTDTAPLPIVAPELVLGCERSFAQASSMLVTADLKMLASCSLATFRCIQSKPVGSVRDACLAKARTSCAKEHAMLDEARGGFESSLNTACGGDPARVPLSLLRASSVLAFETLEPRCRQNAGLSLNSLGAISSCVQTATSCRAERALAIAVPRIADLLAPILDVADSAICVPSPTGNTNGLADPTESKRALSCQAATIVAGRQLVLRRLTLTQKCVDSLLRCRLNGAPSDTCARIASLCDTQLGALSTGARGATTKFATKVARACGPLAPASLLGADGVGFDAASARCNAFGGGPLDALAAPGACVQGTGRSCAANAVGTCVANAFDCAATAIVRDALPLADEELGRFGVALSENPYCADDTTWTSDRLAPANLLDVALKDVHPTQGVLGFDEIYYKLGRYRGTKDEAGGGHNKRFDDWCEANGQVEASSVKPGAQLRDPTSFTCAVPIGSETPDSLNFMKTVVIGPGGQLYLEDGHHTFTEFWQQPDGGPDLHIRVRVVGNLSHLDIGAFWREMQNENRVWLFDGKNHSITVDALPRNVGLANFQNDAYRGLVYFTRGIGYAVPPDMPEYLEFLWGVWLRQRFDLSRFNLTDLASYLDLVKQTSMTMAALSDLQEIRYGRTAAELGKMPAWNAGLPETEGEFAKLSRPLSASKPGKLAYALDYKVSPGP